VRLLRSALTGLAITLSTSAVTAQEFRAVPPNFLEFGRPAGNELRFCLNMASAIVAFDRDFAQAIADTVLLPAEFFEVVDFDPAQPYDYRFTVGEPELFIAVNNECDALMGFRLPTTGTIPEWLAVSRPYLETDMVLAVTDPGYASLSDLPTGSLVGSRLGTPGDSRLRSYLRGLAGAPWTRVPYSGNHHLIDRLLDGTVSGILIWEPALYLFAGGQPETAGLHTAALPFESEPTVFSVAVQTDDQFLLELIDLAISSLIADGVLADLLSEHDLPTSAAAAP